MTLWLLSNICRDPPSLPLFLTNCAALPLGMPALCNYQSKSSLSLADSCGVTALVLLSWLNDVHVMHVVDLFKTSQDQLPMLKQPAYLQICNNAYHADLADYERCSCCRSDGGDETITFPEIVTAVFSQPITVTFDFTLTGRCAQCNVGQTADVSEARLLPTLAVHHHCTCSLIRDPHGTAPFALHSS